MRVEIDQSDIDQIAQRVLELIRPLVATHNKQVEDQVFDVKGLSEYLKVNPYWIYRQVSTKSIPYFKCGKYVRFRKSHIDRWLETRSIRAIH